MPKLLVILRKKKNGTEITVKEKHEFNVLSILWTRNCIQRVHWIELIKTTLLFI